MKSGVRHYRNPKTLALSSKIPACFLESSKARHSKSKWLNILISLENSCEVVLKPKVANLNALKLTFKTPWKSKMKVNAAKLMINSTDPKLQVVGHR